MGNSEVGHLTIGSGRVLFQDFVRVNKAIEDGSFFENPALKSAFARGERTHLLGLVSHGGVHSHIDHVRALLRFAPEKTWLHAFTDGRDVSPHSAVHDLAELPTDTDLDRRGPLLRDGPRPALGADRSARSTRSSTAEVSTRTIRSTPCGAATSEGSRMSSSSPLSFPAGRGSIQHATARSSSTSGPTVPDKW